MKTFNLLERFMPMDAACRHAESRIIKEVLSHATDSDRARLKDCTYTCYVSSDVDGCYLYVSSKMFSDRVDALYRETSRVNYRWGEHTTTYDLLCCPQKIYWTDCVGFRDLYGLFMDAVLRIEDRVAYVSRKFNEYRPLLDIVLGVDNIYNGPSIFAQVRVTVKDIDRLVDTSVNIGMLPKELAGDYRNYVIATFRESLDTHVAHFYTSCWVISPASYVLYKASIDDDISEERMADATVADILAQINMFPTTTTATDSVAKEENHGN